MNKFRNSSTQELAKNVESLVRQAEEEKKAGEFDEPYLMEELPTDLFKKYSDYKREKEAAEAFQSTAKFEIVVLKRGHQVCGGWATVGTVALSMLAYPLSKSPSLSPSPYREAQHLKLRGVDNVDEEFNDLVEASEGREAAKLVKHPWSTLLTRKYRPQLVFAICIPAFQQLTGMNVITFYAPVLFKTIRFGSSASLASALITNGVNFFATFVSIGLADEFGRRFIFLEDGLQMFIITQVVVGSAMAWKFGTGGNPSKLSKGFALLLPLVTLICIYIAGFAWSWDL
ncbi:LOW QUALITY PROTEIN: sugar transport protein 12 [Rosa chinensis]|uniref:LOW QUALITY PROTEIN: sugar transport protein 12 n=1 Tax=Rosa chinensis TaxID=74649 RepID=UPI001AD94103|nr:LOW QUALITY PROTEIN: sugar transport protein 12 [Rosa chinensis]